MKKKSSWDEKDKDGKSAIHHAVKNGNLELVEQMLIAHPELVNA